MSRPLAAFLVVATLAVGITVGALAGALLGAVPASPSTAQSTPASTTAPTPSPTHAPTPGATPEPAPTPTFAPTPAPTPTPEPTPVLVQAPLTGLPVKPAAASRHVIAVMIDDLWAARPQSGLSDAGIVWQAPAEGGIPRYLAFFGDGDPPAVGPIRSTRYYFVAWAAEWNAVLVHVGGSPQAQAVLRSARGRGRLVWNAEGLLYGYRYLWRVTDRYAPHNAYSDGDHLRRLAREVGARPVKDPEPIWRFAPDPPLAARPKGGTLVVPYRANRITYKYDRATNRYLRSVSVEGKQRDAGTKTRIAPKNVVILAMHFAPLNDKKHRLEADLIGKGTAWIASNGETVKGTWRKRSLRGPTLLFGPDGKQVTLTAGQTFVQVVETGTRLTIKDGKVPPPPRLSGRSASGGGIAF